MQLIKKQMAEVMERITNRQNTGILESPSTTKIYDLKCGCGYTTEIEAEDNEINNWKYSQYDCPKCMVIQDKRDNIRLKHTEIRRKIERIKAHLPKKFVSLGYNGNQNPKLLLEKSLYITGKVGTGKTTLAATIFKRRVFKNKYHDRWISFSAFIMRLQGMFKRNDDPYQYAEEIATCEGLLVIDDIGAEKMTEFVRQIAYYIINEREQNERQTIITSNLTLDEINRVVDDRVASRIAGMCTVINLAGKDRRIK